MANAALAFRKNQIKITKMIYDITDNRNVKKKKKNSKWNLFLFFFYSNIVPNCLPMVNYEYSVYGIERISITRIIYGNTYNHTIGNTEIMSENRIVKLVTFTKNPIKPCKMQICFWYFLVFFFFFRENYKLLPKSEASINKETTGGNLSKKFISEAKSSNFT